MKICRIEGCAKSRYGRSSLCGMHLARIRRHGDPDYVTPTRKIAPPDRFWKQVDKRGPDECWPYTGTILSSGYGQFSIGKDVRYFAHRYAYELTFGPIPEGLTIDHVKARGCAGWSCVNPAHLEAVTMQENLRRSNAWSAVNSRKTACPQGHEYDRVINLSDGRVHRRCSICYNANQRARRAKRKAAAA